MTKSYLCHQQQWSRSTVI